MAVKDGSGLRPLAHTAKRCFLNSLETSFKPCFFLPSARVQGPCQRFQTPWQWRTDNCLETIASNLAFSCRQLGCKDRVAGLKHHAAHTAKSCFLNCLETSFKPCFFLPSARVHGLCRRAQTPWQWRTDPARGRQPILPNVAFWTALKLASNLAFTCRPARTTASFQIVAGFRLALFEGKKCRTSKIWWYQTVYIHYCMPSCKFSLLS